MVPLTRSHNATPETPLGVPLRCNHDVSTNGYCFDRWNCHDSSLAFGGPSDAGDISGTCANCLIVETVTSTARGTVIIRAGRYQVAFTDLVALGSVISYLARPGRRGLLISAVSVALIPGSDTMNFAVLFVTRVLFGTYLVLGRPLEFYDFQSIQQQLGFSYVVIFRFRLPYDQFVP